MHDTHTQCVRVPGVSGSPGAPGVSGGRGVPGVSGSHGVPGMKSPRLRPMILL